jgi:hypothetical protein
MENPFCVVEVDPSRLKKTEQVGSKEKFWFYRGEGDAEEEWMCKLSRHHAGEDWSEKIAEQLCSLLGLPHAQYELGTYKTDKQHRRAIVTRRLDREGERLVLGEELLVDHVHRYQPAPEERDYYINPEYTVSIVHQVLIDESLDVRMPGASPLPEGVDTPFGVFVGYLMLDAWIGNTDRHDQNWAVIESHDQKEGRILRLAPTFDHASCLGRELESSNKEAKIASTHEDHSTAGYLTKCLSRFVGDQTKAAIHVIEAFRQAHELDPSAGDAWLQRLSGVPEESIISLFERIPEDRIEAVSVEFALEILEINKNKLLP